MFVIDDIAYAGEPERGMRVVAARPVNNLSMLVTFSTGETRLLDATRLVDLPAFESLSDEGVFSRFSLDHGVLCWCDGEIDLAPEAAYEMSYAYDRTA